MARRVWIVAKKDRIEDTDITDALLNGCPEIANGIPPALEGIITEVMLPCAYEEPELPKKVDWQELWKEAEAKPQAEKVDAMLELIAKRLGLE